MNTLSFASLAGQAAQTTLRLPAGNLDVHDGGRGSSAEGWIVAVGVSPSVYLVTRSHPHAQFPPPLSEQLAGFPFAHQAEVLRADLRYLMDACQSSLEMSPY